MMPPEINTGAVNHAVLWACLIRHYHMRQV